jgi:tetratricopeptide (TPR) repeat protein/transcriptional regulator with XRE-family HTH domain
MADDAAARRGRLAQRRKALGLTQEDLAGLLGVERSTVVRWERGETQPQPWMRPKLARALRVSAERLGELLAGDSPGGAAGPDAAREPTGPGDGPGRDQAAPAVPRQLPAAVAGFTGRTAELETLTQMLDDATGGAPGTVVISAIGGTAGVGKTALALHWAHQVAGRFGDGQLYVNLRGFDPSGIPAEPATAIRGFLDALGVPPERIPAAPDAQAGMYRSLLADRKTLIVLDNARDEQQIRPLLPASPGSLVLVTSRNQLTGLAAADGARLLSLDVLSQAEADRLLIARVGAARAIAEPDAIHEIARLCACLPLALSVAAARAATRPGFPLAAVAAELRDIASRLDALDAGDPAVSVRAVISWSYRQLSTDAARMFRLLGLHPGPDVSAAAAASLAATREPEARRSLGELARAHLVAEHVPGRYAFHDLLRAVATDRCLAHDSLPERQAAVGRLLDHYLHTGGRAALLLRPSHEAIDLGSPRHGTTPGQPADYQQALAWFEAEHQVLLAVVALAAESGFSKHAWQLPWAMMPFHVTRGYYQEWAAVQRVALDVATLSADVPGQALSSRLLASVLLHTVGDLDAASARFASSLALYQRVGNRLGEAKVHQNLGILAEAQGQHADALGHDERALRLYQAVGNKVGEAEMLNAVGWSHAKLGDFEQARDFCRRALALCAELGNRQFEGYSWDSLGYAEHHLGNFGAATTCYQRALGIARETGDRAGEAYVLSHLGDTLHASAELSQARGSWERALAIFDSLHHPEADKVRAKIVGIGG